MTFAWDWLLNNMISSGITDYYQLNVCINHCDFMLYRLGRDKGALLTEAHIIQRTSNNRYSITSYDCGSARGEAEIFKGKAFKENDRGEGDEIRTSERRGRLRI